MVRDIINNMEQTNKNVNILELHCSGINYPKRISFFYIPYPESDHDLVMINDEMAKQIDQAISQDKGAGDSFINTNSLKAEHKHNEIIEEMTTQNNHDYHQNNKILKSTLNHLEVNHNSENNSIVIETSDNESYNEISGSPNLKYYQERKMGESNFYILNKNSDKEYSTQINPEHRQEQHIGESFIYIAYSKNSHIHEEKSDMTNNKIHLNHNQQINTQDNMNTTLAEDIYSTVSDSKENLKDDVFTTEDEKIYSILDKKENKNCDKKVRYPAISLYDAHTTVEHTSTSINTSSKTLEHYIEREINFKLFEFLNLNFDKTNDSTQDEYHNHSQESHAPGLNLDLASLKYDNEIIADDESDYAEPYSNIHNNPGANNQCESTDEHIYSTISDITDNTKETTDCTNGGTASADWIYDTLAMLDSVANSDHVEEVENDASAECEDKFDDDVSTVRISDFNSRSNQLSASCYDLSHTFDRGINQSSISTCDLRPPPLPPKNEHMHFVKSLNETSNSIGRHIYHMALDNDGKAQELKKTDEPVDQRVWENGSYDSQNGSFTQLSSIDEEILQVPVPYGPPPPKPPRLNHQVSCIDQPNNVALMNSSRISKSLSHLPNDNNSQNACLVTATKSVPGGALPLFPSERQQGVQPYKSTCISPKAESFFAKLKKPKVISTKKSCRSGEVLVIGHPYKFQHLNTGIDYLKYLEKEQFRDSLVYLSYDDKDDSMPKEKSFDISKNNCTNSDEEKIYNHFKYTDDMKNKNLELYMDNGRTLLNKKEISNENSRFDSNLNLSDDAKYEKANYR